MKPRHLLRRLGTWLLATSGGATLTFFVKTEDPFTITIDVVESLRAAQEGRQFGFTIQRGPHDRRAPIN